MSGNPRILVVDDDRDYVEAIRAALEDDGYEVLAAYDGEDGLGKAKTADPDLIVLDIMMQTPGEGMYVAQDLRRDEATKAIPIIVATGINAVPPYSLWKDESWLPVDVFMEKPVLPGALLENVRAILGKPKARAQST